MNDDTKGLQKHHWIKGLRKSTATDLGTAGSDAYKLSLDQNILCFSLKLISVAFEIRSLPLFEETFNQVYSRVQKPGSEQTGLADVLADSQNVFVTLKESNKTYFFVIVVPL